MRLVNGQATLEQLILGNLIQGPLYGYLSRRVHPCGVSRAVLGTVKSVRGAVGHYIASEIGLNLALVLA